MDVREEALRLHEAWQGKIEVRSRVRVTNSDELSIVYTPGVAEPCLRIKRDPDLVDTYTRRWNTVAVVTDGSSVLGLGNIGPRAALPVMEGKCVLFKSLGGVDAFPLCLDTQDPDELVRAVSLLAPCVGGINLEDISAPRCFDVEDGLKAVLDIPVFHDDQHGTAIVVAAALINACRLAECTFEDFRIVVNGAGAAGLAVSRMLLDMGVRDIVLCDSKGIVSSERPDLNGAKQALLPRLNPRGLVGGLMAAMTGASVFIGVSVGDIVSEDMVRAMRPDPVVLALANPTPEIHPAAARRAGAAVIATGRSDYPNQVNNVLGFPGVFRGALDVRAHDINQEMKVAAARALAALVGDRLSPEYVLPAPLDRRVAPAVAAAVAQAAVETGVARKPRDPEWVAMHTREMVGERREF